MLLNNYNNLRGTRGLRTSRDASKNAPAEGEGANQDATAIKT